MKKIIIFIIIFLAGQFLYAQTFTMKELISLNDLPTAEVVKEVLKKGYKPPTEADKDDPLIFDKADTSGYLIIYDFEHPKEKKVQFATNYENEWLALQNEMEASDFVRYKDPSGAEGIPIYNKKNIEIKFYIFIPENPAMEGRPSYITMITETIK